MPTFSFLILTYNSSLYIKPLFDSIFDKLSKEIKNGKIELIIVDNASTDTTIENINKYFEDKKNNIVLHESNENLGYARGINKASTFANGEFLVVVNPDSVLQNFDGDRIIQEFENEKNMAIAGFNLLDYGGVKEKTAGRFFNPVTFLFYALGLEGLARLRFSPPNKTKVDFVSGGFVVFRKDYYEKMHGYDEDYFMYVEDMDICFRAKKRGYSVFYLPFATIKHRGQGSSNREFAIVNIYKGLQLFYTKHGSFLSQLYVRNLLSIKAALIIFISVVIGKKNLGNTYTKALKAIS